MAAWINQMRASPEYKILEPLIQPNASTTTAEVALQEIDKLTTIARSNTSEGNKALGNHSYAIWVALLDIVDHNAPPKQSKLVDFVVQLQKKELVDSSTGEVLKTDGHEYWAELPALGYTVTDNFQANPMNLNLTPEQKAQWENFNGFLAQLTAASKFEKKKDTWDIIDASLKGLSCLGDAFGWGETSNEEPEEEEEESDDEEPKNEEFKAPPREYVKEEFATGPTTTAVRAACWWFIYAAERMWANIKKNDDGKDGFNYERWALWEQGLLDFKTSADEDTGKLIDDALAGMKKAKA